ncbi:hypothetical protein [Methanogenium organophilum]|uniref:DUF3566 domain-containing protein n=1 Tax=Methanogenium organophilum TaxID=2199 RepID=A0A9X9S2F5_METOG|nr:hypothetical protein [Methanogenium organophilum]WAI00298.1 hypothetical protein OU421_07600 [Methanogenium organophilum]
MAEIRSINVFSCAKIFAAVSLVLGFIAAVLAVLVAIFGVAAAPFYPLPVGEATLVWAIVAILVLTVVYAIIGFITGAIVAVIYNLAAGIFGGLKIDFADTEALVKESEGDHDRSYE